MFFESAVACRIRLLPKYHECLLGPSKIKPSISSMVKKEL
jgi:hypothetical protein